MNTSSKFKEHKFWIQRTQVHRKADV